MHVNLHRCAWGGATVTGVASVYSVVALYNAGQAAEYLAVRAVSIPAAPNAVFNFGIAQGPVGTMAGALQAIVTGEAPAPGAIYTSTTAVAPAFYFSAGTSNNQSQVWHHEFPLALLTPGSSLVVAAALVDVTLSAYFWAEAIKPEQLHPSALLDEQAIEEGRIGDVSDTAIERFRSSGRRAP